MRERAPIHIAGPAGAGKTAFVERLLDAHVALAICVRGERDAKLRKDRESAPKDHAELGRYRAAGASAVALYRFPEPGLEAFFLSDVMESYSEAVFIEGDCPLEYVDLTVFVAPAPPPGGSLLRRVMRERLAPADAAFQLLAREIEGSGAMARLLGLGPGESLAGTELQQERVLTTLRRGLKAKAGKAARARALPPTEHWALAAGYEGIERAQLVVVNVRSDADRGGAEALVAEVARLRKDEEVRREVLGPRGSKIPVTAVVADLSDPADAGLKKAVARVKRATRRRSP